MGLTKQKKSVNTFAIQKESIISKTPKQVFKIANKINAVKTKRKASVKKSPKKRAPQKNQVSKAKTEKFSLKIKPMLATLVNDIPSEKDWQYEVKWDGYRALAFMNNGKIELKSRNDKSFNDKFYPLVAALRSLNINAVVDGEVIVVNEQGISNFGSLQNWRSEADGDLIFYLFDILWHDGKDLMPLVLTERRKILEKLIPQNDSIRISERFITDGKEFYEVAKKMGLEGIIAKKLNSEYHPGSRSKEWLKIKANKRQEMVIGGYTMNEDSSKPFSSLLAGVFENKKLIYTGKIGTGFDIKTQKEILQKLNSLKINKCPFTCEPDINKPSRFRPNPPKAKAVWVKPKLVCEVSFTEITSDGVMRHPSFEGLRIDKKATEVVYEIATNVLSPEEKNDPKIKKALAPSRNKERKTLLNPKEETQVKKISGHEIKFNNLSKIYWPKENISKRDMLNYYYKMAPYILPYVKDRPQSMNRFPNGIKGMSFYQKDVTGKVPSWIETYLYHSSADNRDRHYLVPKTEADILYMASLGCIELNPWNSRVNAADNPDWCIIDLDPDKNSFNQVIEAAQVTRSILDSIKVPSYPKTSGSTGLHIYIPLGAKYSYEESKEFARVIATLVHREIPKFTSIERMIKNRDGKMYIDFLQNRPQATVAGPYVLRPKPGAPVSMPLHWEEVKKGIKISDYNIFNAYDRVKNEGDIFKPVIGKGINLEKVVKLLNK